MTTALLFDGLVQGVKSWDVLIAKALSLAILANTGARAGDVARSDHYTSENASRLRDVTIKIIKQDDGTLEFKLKIVLKFTKGFK
jgi:hypothetical protein